MSTREKRVLMVDDSAEDIFLISRALRKHGQLRWLGAVRDGFEAMAYLRGEGQYADRERFPLPHILLIDLYMPVMSGFQLLSWVQEQGLSGLRTVIISGSNVKGDRERAFALGADGYILKDLDMDEPGAIAAVLEHLDEKSTREDDQDDSWLKVA